MLDTGLAVGDVGGAHQFKHGQSNPTYLLQVSGVVQCAKYVLRKKPPGKVLSSAHAVEREFQVMAALGGTNVPVPRALCLCTDAAIIGTPFYVMQHVQGRIFTDPSCPELAPEERAATYAAMAATLASLHSVQPTAVGLSRFGRSSGYCKRQVWRWAQQYRSQLTGPPLPQMAALISWLEAHIPPEDGDPSATRISHGDFRLDNLVVDPRAAGRVLAVLDWELCTLGHPFADLAYSAMPYHLPAGIEALPSLPHPLPPGVPTESKYIAAYCSARGIALPTAEVWSFFMALSLFRAAAILAGVGARAKLGNASSDRAAAVRSPWRDAVAAAGFEPPPHVAELRERVRAFMRKHVYPAEPKLEELAASDQRWTVHPLMEEMKAKAKAEGLWNLWISPDLAANIRPALPVHEQDTLLLGAGLSNLEYAFLSEEMGRIVFASEVFNCSAPDTGNMEVLARYGSLEQKRRWLLPLLRGEIRSCFAMTEPEVASSDATNIQSSIKREGREYVLNGHKWWASGAMDPRCQICIFMGKTDPSAPTHKQQSMILVPMDSKGVKIVRPLTVFGYDDAPHGHAEVLFQDVRVPASNMLLGEGRGFEIAQGRLGPGRLHHCMRAIGMGERALELMGERALGRTVFRRRMADHGGFQQRLARARIDLDAARLTVLDAAHALDRLGNKQARGKIAAAKVLAPSTVLAVLDAAIQAHGGAGVSEDVPLARLWAGARTLRIADGPDDVHLISIAKLELAHRRSKM
ncbi:acyl-CoA dehydrogenase NM domain-like protein [Coccomyxa subellipsoidea C-169]|uniref:Acyl-CoA dehydrogenase family member 11 n=1 Tax=Coccomyxa subellipsoidea (strain C-169) TaxID=574566 RepID=I0Z2L9_COCSC|nr:acyl-CoA dehydrogenase NM domain-like protein [Coccomyxa subellipsoidea C-169]EIE24888.1 acyl-CoA dehydrogenase NM domain-like protein [Coccomyxa subellipsoidea C-169]|eukprot:XP_005649432.1 acyl-CoA dehydrogenase NM domain-like protein [Coccomyxa subellipsoidea C-169]